MTCAFLVQFINHRNMFIYEWFWLSYLTNIRVILDKLCITLVSAHSKFLCFWEQVTVPKRVKERKGSCQVGFLISPCCVTWLVLHGALEAETQPTQGSEIGLLEGGEKWCKITRGNIRPNLGGKKKLSHESGHCRRDLGQEKWGC